MVIKPFSELGSCGVRGVSYVEVSTCEVLKHFLCRRTVTAHGRVEVKLMLGA
jgi:hypothetical protein